MPCQKPFVELYSYGIYETWDRLSKKIPGLLKITTKIVIIPGIEFGYVLNPNLSLAIFSNESH